MSSETAQVFDFIINRRGGTVLNHGEDTVRKEILTQFGDKAGTFTYVEGKDVAATVKTWAAEHAGQNRGLVIGGGDGTVVTAVEQILGRDDIILGILPLGTQNLVARQLGFSADFKKAAAQYKNGQSVEMDVGVVNDMHFLVGITLDQNSVNFFEAREDLRDKKHFSAIKKGVSSMTGVLAGAKDKFRVSTEKGGHSGKSISGRLIAITNNSVRPLAIKSLPYSGAEFKNIVTNMLGKGDQSTGELSLYAFKGGLIKIASILPDIMSGKWDKHKSVERDSAQQFFVETDGAQQRSLILDGEIKKVQYPLEVRIIPNGVKMFKPQ